MTWLRLLGSGAFALAAAAVPDFTFLSLCAAIWIAPRWIGVGRIDGVLFIVAIEIIAVSAAGVLALTLTADRGSVGLVRAAILTLWLAALLSLAIAIAVKRGDMWPALGFSVQTGNRLAGWWTAPDAVSRRAGIASGVLSLLFYVSALLLTTYVPFPALGLTPAVKAEAGLVGGALWDTDPQRGLAAGILYFGSQAVYRRAQRRARS
jgi:hypothetical protein